MYVYQHLNLPYDDPRRLRGDQQQPNPPYDPLKLRWRYQERVVTLAVGGHVSAIFSDDHCDEHTVMAAL